MPYAETLMNTWQLAKKEVVYSAPGTVIAIGAIASLWEAYLTPWLEQLYLQQESLRIEIQIASRKSLLRQLYERELDLLITTDAPKMDELDNQLLGKFSLQLYSSASSNKPKAMSYIKLEWDGDCHQQGNGHGLNEQMIILTTPSACLACELLEKTGSYAWLPEHWGQKYPQLIPSPAPSAIVRPLYAVWLKNSDQQLFIQELLKISIKNVIR